MQQLRAVLGLERDKQGAWGTKLQEALTARLVQMAGVNPVLTSCGERQRVLPEVLGRRCLACLALVSFLQGSSN